MGVALLIVLFAQFPRWFGMLVRSHWFLFTVFALLVIVFVVHRLDVRWMEQERRRRTENKYRSSYEKKARSQRNAEVQRIGLEFVRRSGIEWIDSWSKDDKGIMFENLMAQYFELKGCIVKKTPATGDFGVDLLVTNPKTGVTSAVQCKCYDPKYAVPKSAVQEVASGKIHYSVGHAMVVTNSRLTDQGKELAKSTGVDVWEREELIRYLALANKSDENEPDHSNVESGPVLE